MWRTVLVWAIRAAVASGLKDKAVDWLKGKLVKHLVNLENRINVDLDKVEAAAGPVVPLPEAK